MADLHVQHQGRQLAAAGAQPSRAAQQRALRWALLANGSFLAIEAGAGLIIGSLALLADAAHMLSDVAALGVALVAQRLLTRPATARHSYGLQRADVLGALINGIGLVVVTGWIVWEAIERLGQPVEVAGGPLLGVAVAGLAVNVASAVALARVRGRSLNLHGAFVHMAADALGSVAAAMAGVAVLLWGAAWADAAASLAISALVLWAAWGLLRDTFHVLMEGTPRGMDVGEIRATMEAEPQVDLVHHLHLWNLASDTPALSAHVVLAGDVSLHQAQAHGDRLKELLRERFGIAHATLELECHPCDPLEPECE